MSNKKEIKIRELALTLYSTGKYDKKEARKLAEEKIKKQEQKKEEKQPNYESMNYYENPS